MTERRRQLLLGIVALALAGGVYAAWPRTAAAPAPASNQRAQAPAAGARNAPGASNAPDVHLEALEAEHPKPGPADRNLFRFKPKAPPPPPPAPVRPGPQEPAMPVPTGPPPPPPTPPIAVKFIGLVEQAAGSPKIAVLSDSAGHVFYGSEGEIVEGRYRILKIGVESIEISYADGRGRQTIRLAGS